MTDPNDFQLHPDLERDGVPLGSFALCRVLLLDDANYPWFVLVPARPEIVELTDLSAVDYTQLWQESRAFCSFLQSAFTPDKLNVATLGNMTPQLHVHHVVRYRNDAAWPKPIWGAVPAKRYHTEAIETIREQLAIGKTNGFSPA